MPTYRRGNRLVQAQGQNLGPCPQMQGLFLKQKTGFNSSFAIILLSDRVTCKKKMQKTAI